MVAGNSIPTLPPGLHGPSKLSSVDNSYPSSGNLVTPQQLAFHRQKSSYIQNQLPQQLAQQTRHSQNKPSVDSVPENVGFTPTKDKDLLALRDANFDAQKYILSKLGTASDVEISEFSEKIINLQGQAAVDRENMKYGNYKTFLAVGSQITVLSSELQTLRKLVNDLHAATTAMKQDAEQIISNKTNNYKPSSNTLNVPGHNELPTDSLPELAVPLPSRVHNSGSKNNRNSALVLESMWAQDLSGLFKSVEGAQKYIPPIPGRHVVKESAGWDQLNAATWKPWQPVKVYLLNDCLLIAARKRSKQGDMLAITQSSQWWIADQCWPLTEIAIKDLNSLEGVSGTSRFGFVVFKDTNVYVYNHHDSKAASSFFESYSKLTKSIRSGKSNRDSTQSNRNSIYGGIKGKGGKSGESEAKGHKRSASMDISERTRVLREIDTITNTLDFKIAHRNFSEAVSLIERHNKEVSDVREVSEAAIAAAQAASATFAIGGSISGPSGPARRPTIAAGMSTAHAPQNPQVTDIKALRVQILKIKLDQRAKEISDILLSNVTQDYFGPGETKQHLNLLTRLGQGDIARKAFLSSRRQLISKRVKSVEFEGDIPNFISQIVVIYFRLIRATAEIYQECFPLGEETSTLVEWARTEVENYAVIFARQLYNIPQESEIYRQCVNITKAQAEQLKGVGLIMDFLLDFIYKTQSPLEITNQ